ncbi:hypothetical protein [Anaerobaca lacustris]|uniref:DUF4177 domain-containing protein n=1 Tax=Anaerobaca lacustris TaxID=3044600 RepID=A0AAW6TWI6_9BACT|nr:hypothetical protein [Sedimentisphaerales bacterium M17dextr]
MRQVAILTLLFCCAGCSRSPYPVYYQKTADGLKPTERPKSFVAERVTPEALETRTEELLAEGYVVIGRSEFVSAFSRHKEIHRRRDSRGAEIILFSDTEDPTATHSYTSRRADASGGVGTTRHVAVYFARPRAARK